jgi:glycine/D-amino acid oxidase-like deaminating enzyme
MWDTRTTGHNAAPARPPVLSSCYWLASRHRPAGSPLEGRHETDVAIVGGGLTGLWTAISLKALEPSLPVVVLEQGIAAYGASGRNAGILAETIDHSHDLAIAHFGPDEARRLARLGKENVARMLRFLDEHGIGCDLERTGTLVVALVPSHVDELRQAVERARELGVSPPRLLSAEEIRAEIHSDRYKGGLLLPGGAILDPVKLTEGLKQEAERRGVAVFEQTRVTDIATVGPGVQLHTAGGEVRAQRAVLATSAYSHHLLPRLRSRFIPFYDYIITSEPLSAEQKAAIGWRGRQGVADARAFFKYYRLTADDRVLWGTSEAAYYRGNRVDVACDHSERHYAELRDSFRRHFPALADLEFPYAWGGAICATTRFTPFFGSALEGRVLYGLGYTGHGLGTTHLAGEILAHMALGRPSPLLDLELVRRKPFPYPPEPLRSLAVAAVTKALRRVDAGGRPSLLLRCLDAMGIGLSS